MNPIVFHDYENFIRKFTEKPKTTDECWTPQDVYEAVVKYVGEIYDLTGKLILRPFYPGGDYENAEYPENGVVIDNPPFSMFTKICKFYCAKDIPFFLFGPGLTIFSICNICTAVIVPEQLTFSNKAFIRCNFATNLMGDIIATTAIRLGNLLRQCPSQREKVNLPKYAYPEEVLSVSDFQTIAKGEEDFSISRKEAMVIRNLDLHQKKGELFGNHILARKAAARKAAAREAAARKAIQIELSAREKAIVASLGNEES